MPPPESPPTGPLHLLHVSPSFGLGGRELRAVELMGMMPAGTRNSVIALDGNTGSLARVADGVRVDVVDPCAGGSPVARLRSMRALLRELVPDLLLTYNWGAIEWLLGARSCGMRAIVHTEDGFGPEEVDRFLLRRVWARRVMLRWVRAVVVPSRRLYDVGRTVWRQPDSRLVYLPNGVDLERFRPTARAVDGADVVFGCVGRIRAEKAQDLAVEALARAKCRERARLVIVGDGPESDRVQALAVELGVADRVEFTGPVMDTAPVYARLDAFLIPSRTEQMPLALLEAMACALPTVGSDVGDVAQMVAPQNQRWIVPKGDADVLARAMDDCADDPSGRAECGAANRRKVEQEFDRATCYGAYIDLYLKAARGG